MTAELFRTGFARSRNGGNKSDFLLADVVRRIK